MLWINKFNHFRLIGDLSHIFAIIFLPLAIWKTGSCEGVSGRTQVLLLTVHITRYVDVFFTFLSVYNTSAKILYTLASFITVYLIYWQFRKTHDRENDTFNHQILTLIALFLAIFVNHELAPLEYWWTFSIYMESVAIIPQLYMTYKSQKTRSIVSIYILFLAIYRTFYLFNWITRYYCEGHYDLISSISGTIQIFIYTIYIVILCISKPKSPTPNVFTILEPTLIISTATKDAEKVNLVTDTTDKNLDRY